MAALILAAVLWFVLQPRDREVTTSPTASIRSTDADPTTPAPSGDTSTDAVPDESPSTGPAPSASTQLEPGPGGTSSSLPLMPSKVGDYTPFGEVRPDFAVYVNDEATVSIVAFHLAVPGGKGEYFEGTDDVSMIGEWACGFEPESETSICVTDSYDGILSLTGTNTRQEVVDFGDDFVSLWK